MNLAQPCDSAFCIEAEVYHCNMRINILCWEPPPPRPEKIIPRLLYKLWIFLLWLLKIYMVFWSPEVPLREMSKKLLRQITPPPGDLLLHMCLEIKVFNQKRTTLFKSIKQTNKQTPNTKSLAYLNKNCSNSVTSKTVCSFSKKPTGLMLGWKI